MPETKSKVQLHKEICTEINELYAKKNHDYGDSFHQTFVEEGMAMARIRLGDKFNRFKTLSRGNEQKVNDESIRDTLIDLANYAIMTVLEMEVADHDAE
nr:MAG TPA: Nucleotide modification associated domain 1 [Caudoviricetes sp.]